MALQLYPSLEFRCQIAGCREETLNVVENLHCFLGVTLVTRRQGVFRHGDGCESLGKHVATLAQRTAVGCHGKIHVAVVVEAIFLDEIEGFLRCVEPFGTFFHIIIRVRAREGETTLKPDGLRRVHQASVAIQTGVNAAIFVVKSVFQPKRHDVLGQIALVASRPVGNILFCIHFFILNIED